MSLDKKTVAQVESETQDEINELIQSLDEAAGDETADGPRDISDFHGSTEEASMEETLGGLKGEETTTEGGVLDESTEAGSTQNSAESGTLSMVLSGNMTLKLKYEFDGQEVSIGFKDNALQLQLSDGTEFKIPVRKRNLKLVS